MPKITDRRTGVCPDTRKRSAGFTLERPSPRIYHFKFGSLREMGLTFVRFQEHYESPAFRGRVFSLGEFKRWYCEFSGQRSFTNCSDFHGFNVPDHVLEPFRAGKFPNMTARERALLHALRDCPKPFYVIGTSDRSGEGCERHELCHALWYLEPAYRLEAEDLLSDMPLELWEPVRQRLCEYGYSEEVLDDEANAYLSDRARDFCPGGRRFASGLAQWKPRFEALFDRHWAATWSRRRALPGPQPGHFVGR